MNTKLARALALVVAVLLAWLVWHLTRPEPAAPPADGPAAGTGARLPDPFGSPSGGAAEPAPAQPGEGTAGEGEPGPVPSAMPTELPPVGTEVKPGQEVSIVVPWRRVARAAAPSGEGTAPTSPSPPAAGAGVRRFEIEDVSIWRDRATDVTEPMRWHWHVVLEVIEGAGDGTARLRLKLERFRFQGLHPQTGLLLSFDSAAPESTALEHPVLGPRFRPLMALVGLPGEFRIDGTGRVTGVEGVDHWRERFESEFQHATKTTELDSPSVPSVAAFVDTWSEFLFPRLGGGTVRGGETREWKRLQPQVAPWAILWTGTLRATRDDPDAFRVDVTAAPKVENVGGSAADASLAKMHVVGAPDAYRAAYRVSREDGTVIEAQIDARYQLWQSRRVGGSPTAPQYQPTFYEILRRAIVRRVAE